MKSTTVQNAIVALFVSACLAFTCSLAAAQEKPIIVHSNGQTLTCISVSNTVTVCTKN